MTQPTIRKQLELVMAELAELKAARPAPRAKKVVEAFAVHLTTPELLALKGQCSPSAQAIVEGHVRKGDPNMGEYVAKLATFCNDPARPSPRYRYALAMYAAMKGGVVKVRKVKPTAA